MPRKDVNHLNSMGAGKSLSFEGTEKLWILTHSANSTDYKKKNKTLVITLIAQGC